MNKNVLMISGSTRKESSNTLLLNAISKLDENKSFELSRMHSALPVFEADLDSNPLPKPVLDWRSQVGAADSVIICIPEYIHNMPAIVKNALEWLASSGELVGKKVLAITYTPNEPRGEKAMQSMLWSLQALDANIVASLNLYKTEINITNNQITGESKDLLREAVNLL